MKCQYVIDKFNLIDLDLNAVKTSTVDPKLGSMLSSYLVVFISGIYEDCVEHLFVERAGKNNDQELRNFMEAAMHRSFRNPEYSNIKGLVKYLDSSYGKTLDSKARKNDIEGLNGIVTNKNLVAHGGVSNATLEDVIKFHKGAKNIFEALENILKI